MKKISIIACMYIAICGCNKPQPVYTIKQIQESANADVDFTKKYQWEDLIRKMNPNKSTMRLSPYKKLPRVPDNIHYYTISPDGSTERPDPPGRPAAICEVSYEQTIELFSEARFYASNPPPSREDIEQWPFYTWISVNGHEAYVSTDTVIVDGTVYYADRNLVDFDMKEPHCLNATQQ